MGGTCRFYTALFILVTSRMIEIEEKSYEPTGGYTNKSVGETVHSPFACVFIIYHYFQFGYLHDCFITSNKNGNLTFF